MPILFRLIAYLEAMLNSIVLAEQEDRKKPVARNYGFIFLGKSSLY